MQTGWLSPTGEFIKCDTYDHLDVARQLTHDGCYADDLLLKRGYVKISRSLMGRREQAIYYDLRHTLTPEQVRFLRPYFEENDIPVSEVTQQRWEMGVR